jgi:hypothetical protein
MSTITFTTEATTLRTWHNSVRAGFANAAFTTDRDAMNPRAHAAGSLRTPIAVPMAKQDVTPAYTKQARPPREARS